MRRARATDAAQRAGASGAARLERERGLRTRFVVRQGSAHHFVPVDLVDWIDAADNYLQLHAGGRAHLVRGTMKDAEQELDPAVFVRVHRSAMVNVNYIVGIDAQPAGYAIRLSDGTKLRTSRQYAVRVRELLQPFRR